MMRVVAAGLMTIALLGAQSALAGSACSEPGPLTDIPSGASATREQMLSAQRTLKAYDIAIKAYSDCLRESGDTTNRANMAVDQLTKLAETFNVELHAFKERNGAG
jgi:hypothetical protein